MRDEGMHNPANKLCINPSGAERVHANTMGEMPWFRFVDEVRVTLRFRDGACDLTFANLTGDLPWGWVAEKRNSSKPPVVLVRAGNMLGLRVALRESGFQIETGSVAERIMRAAVRAGVAEELPDDERWREELIAARRKRKT